MRLGIRLRIRRLLRLERFLGGNVSLLGLGQMLGISRTSHHPSRQAYRHK